MLVRFRALRSRFNFKEFVSTVRETTTDLSVGDVASVGRYGRGGAGVALPAILGAGLLKGGSGLASLITGYANTPRDVDTDEQTAAADDVRQLLEAGRLSTRDLVDTGDGWKTFSEHPLFEDTCDAIADRAKARKRLVIAGVTALVVAVAGLAFFLLRH